MPSGEIRDRGIRGLIIEDRPLKLSGAAWLEQTGATVLFDDFVGDTLNTNLWLATETATGVPWAVSATAGDPVAGHGGWASAQTDNVDAGAEELGAATSATVGTFRPDRAGNGMLVFQCRLTIPTATTARIINAGFTDDPTEGSALAMSLSTVTWTTTASDAALWVFSSLATANTTFLGQTVDSDVDGTHIVSAVTAAADTATVLRVELDSLGQAYFYQTNGATAEPAYQGYVSVGTSPDVLHCPYVALGSTTTTAADIELDYVVVGCAR